MALIPIKIPAGIYRVGTDLEGANRWRDANLVRWHQGSMRPVGGWSEKADVSASLTATPRAMHVWIDNTSGANTAIGTASELIYVNASGTATDITPAGFTTGDDDAAINTSYGGSFYGTGLYGVKRPSTGQFQEADVWTLDNWGEYLVGCSTSDGKLYEWQLNTANPAAQISNSPTSCKSMLVTEERFIFAFQAGGNPRKISWCDREDNTVWTAAATNEAGDIELQTSGEIMCGARMRGRSIILTNIDAHIATYQGPPYVYGFERVGTACGAVSRNSLVAVDQGAFWMGSESFYMFDGSVARQMPCDVQDYVFEGMNKNQVSKVFAVHNSEYGEIWWFYPGQGSTECDTYVAYDYLEQHWEIGTLARTCGADQGVFDEPLWVDPTGLIYEHELHGVQHGTDTPFAETGPISLGNGDQIMKVNKLIPDEDTQGEVQVKFKTRFHPNDTEREYGAYTMSNPTSVRFSGRQIRMRVEATGNEDWRVGIMRINAEPGGSR
jgi:hypothetical protein